MIGLPPGFDLASFFNDINGVAAPFLVMAFSVVCYKVVVACIKRIHP
jgi:hypothetical protein